MIAIEQIEAFIEKNYKKEYEKWCCGLKNNFDQWNNAKEYWEASKQLKEEVAECWTIIRNAKEVLKSKGWSSNEIEALFTGENY